MDSSSSDKFDMLKMLTQHMRSKRATDDIFELGDRLTEKLKSEQQKMQAQFGNASCVLQELDIVDPWLQWGLLLSSQSLSPLPPRSRCYCWNFSYDPPPLFSSVALPLCPSLCLCLVCQQFSSYHHLQMI